MILIYARVSSIEQAEEGAASIPDQLRKCRALASMRGAAAADCMTFVDKGVSGSMPLSERPQGAELLAAARKGDIVIASKMDRLFRSAVDALTTADVLRSEGIDLILIDLGTDPVTGNGTAKLFFSMLAIMAEFERDRIRERTEEGRRSKRARRGFMGGGVPFGYKVVGKGREAQIEEDEREQAALAAVKRLVKQGHQPYRIGKYLTTHHPARSGKPWQVVQVQRVMAQLDGIYG
jgi:DNA invertase Pin-like site-specific DNA recombinase